MEMERELSKEREKLVERELERERAFLRETEVGTG
jgi:hypothetical protein